MRGANHAISATLHVAFIAFICAFSNEAPSQGERKKQINEIEIEFIVSKPSSSSSSSITDSKQRRNTDLAQKKKVLTQKLKNERATTQPNKTKKNIHNAVQVNNDNNTSGKKIKGESSLTSKTTNDSEKQAPSSSQIATSSNVKPACRRCIKPKYPRTALQKSQEGYVLVELTVNASGRVNGARVIKSSGITSIDNAALNAAKKSTFVKQSRNTRFTIAYDLKISK